MLLPMATHCFMAPIRRWRRMRYSSETGGTTRSKTSRRSRCLAAAAGSWWCPQNRPFDHLLIWSKRQTGGVSFAVGATGYQLAVILLANSSGLVANIVPYKGTPQAITDVIGQQVTATMSDFGTMRALIEAGKVRPILAFADRRIAAIPGVPSLKDLKLDIPTLFSWTALFAAAGTS